jgi:hypothetical protein
MMAKGTSKWLLGCGIGCGVIVLIVVVALVGGLFFLRSTLKGFDEAIADRKALEQKYGQAADFAPRPDGAIPAERMLVFLAVRDSLKSISDSLAESFDTLYRNERAKQRGESGQPWWRMFRTGVGMAEEISDFYLRRNQQLLVAGMGLGEYTYIYVLSYYVWLGHSPTEGPEDITVRVDEQTGDLTVETDGGKRRINIQGTAAPLRRICRDLRLMLQHQLQALDEESPSADPEWRRRLSEEIARLEAGPLRLPWRDGLPEAVVASFEPYRSRLEGSYRPATNLFELGINHKRGLSIHAE